MRDLNRIVTLAATGWLLICGAATARAQITSERFALTTFNAPVEMVPHPTDPATMFIVEQGGLIRVWQNGSVFSGSFLDLRGVISTGGERGLLGMAFAPDWATSRRFYVNFTNAAGHTVVARFTTTVGPPSAVPSADVASRFDLRWSGPGGTRWIAQPYSNHNGGHIEFGPDGYLYVGMGDGGSSGDPENRAQDPNTLLGKMLRIDVNVPTAHTEGYVIPGDNPFVGGGALPEIWAFGLRNPWKFTFDVSGRGGAGTLAMVMGDVGQGTREEVNYQPAGRGGRNYGWRLREGALPYLPATPPAYLPLTEPILDYPRSEGQSITGGYVYRGSSLRSGFRGRYFFADFVSGRVWSVALTPGTSGEATASDRVEHTAELGGASVLGNIAAFARDSLGELYVLSFNGNILKLVHDPASTGPIGGTPGPVSSVPPIGQVDTPTQDATGVVGAIAITGWALDDAGVAHVRIYRDCLTGIDAPASCQMVLGRSVVYVGQPSFLPGARPDIETAFSSYPNASQAGWGMLILSPMLPHVPLGQGYGGQGGMTFSVVATDNDGLAKLLGRSWGEGTSGYDTRTSVTLANDTIAKPFGTIDTPAEGVTVGGTLSNFGWALTPDTNTVADGPADTVLPVSGATMRVFVDGAVRGTVTYNQCRGPVGTPVPAGVFCDDDVASAFGNVSPQPVLTPRTSNPTRYRNLDAGRGAIGVFGLDTTTLSNGRHTLAWGVEDSSGRVEGLGSRYFTVQNGADAPRVDVRRSAVALHDTLPSAGQVWGRTGFNPFTSWELMRPDTKGQHHVKLTEMGRFEMELGAAPQAAYMRVNGSLRELPVGALLEEGRFTWAPPPGYLGTYHLVFLRDDERTDVLVTVVPPRQSDGADSGVRMSLDHVRLVSNRRGVRASGWALDTDAPLGTGVGAVHVWAQSSSGPVFLGAADLGGERPDVSATHGAPFGLAGFDLTSTVTLAPGTYTITAYVWLERTQRWEDARSLVLTVR